ncbi:MULTISPECIES: YbaB/EbfC family nucleoid-associated protein [Glycomyces]|uniref:DNA-binding protein YbaB n=1 Tax=Glycomyces artemisiae TaxID=1076443 RepID=A0A2T0UTJ2_9ACTN|nr:YbaB/EbfC family nucleoid-associated protein [Glycomyces artemisiae]PRY61251.1 DNA-binding protein YbaB [Glycomyces artemisiae]
MHGDIHSRLAEAQRLAAEVTAEVESEDGTVRVTAGPGGDIRRIDLSMSAFDLSGVELGETVTALVKAAADEADRELSEAIRQTLAGMFSAERQEKDR